MSSSPASSAACPPALEPPGRRPSGEACCGCRGETCAGFKPKLCQRLNTKQDPGTPAYFSPLCVSLLGGTPSCRRRQQIDPHLLLPSWAVGNTAAVKLFGKVQNPGNMDPEERRVSGKTFYVYCAGKTNGAERQIVAQLKATGQIESTSTENSDYLVVFCPVSSRVGTDIKDALDNVRDDKAVILVVMHHTFDRNHVISESRRQVDKSNVILTVDYLFHENKILDCSRNDIALFVIKKTLGVPNSQLSPFFQFCARCRNWISIYRWQIIGFSLGIMLIVVITLVVVEKKKK